MIRKSSPYAAAWAGAAALALGAASTAVSAPPADATPPADAATPARLSSHAQLQRELDAVVAAGATGATAQVVDGRHRVRASSGVAERGAARPVPQNGRFRIGSVSKTFVATVVLQLVDEGELALDDTVDDRLPGVLPAGTGITVRQLLNHTSGVPDVLTTFPPPGTPEFVDLRWQSWTTEELVARVAGKPLLFAPGTQADYSNTNYLLLGLMIERVTGQTYDTAIEQRIIRPLQLRHTSVPLTDPFIHGPHAHGYMPVQQPDGSTSIVDVTTFDPTIMGPGGNMISTTRDLNRFFDELLNGDLVPEDLRQQLRDTALDSKYGLGIIEYELPCGGAAWGKDGDAPGYSTWSFTADGGKQVTVSVTWGTGDPDDAVDALLDAELCS